MQQNENLPNDNVGRHILTIRQQSTRNTHSHASMHQSDKKNTFSHHAYTQPFIRCTVLGNESLENTTDTWLCCVYIRDPFSSPRSTVYRIYIYINIYIHSRRRKIDSNAYIYVLE